MSYDEECSVLARHFLIDIGKADDAHVELLAQHIQESVEEFLKDSGLAVFPSASAHDCRRHLPVEITDGDYRDCLECSRRWMFIDGLWIPDQTVEDLGEWNPRKPVLCPRGCIQSTCQAPDDCRLVEDSP